MWHGLPWWLSNKEITYQCRKRGFNPWAGKLSWKRKWQPNPVFIPGKSHGYWHLGGYSPWCLGRVRHDLAAKQQQRFGTVQERPQTLLLPLTDGLVTFCSAGSLANCSAIGKFHLLLEVPNCCLN